MCSCVRVLCQQNNQDSGRRVQPCTRSVYSYWYTMSKHSELRPPRPTLHPLCVLVLVVYEQTVRTQAAASGPAPRVLASTLRAVRTPRQVCWDIR